MIKGNSFFQESLLDADPDWSAANLVMLAIPTVSAVVAGAGLHQRPELPLYHLQQESSSGWHLTIASCEQKDNFDRVQWTWHINRHTIPELLVLFRYDDGTGGCDGRWTPKLCIYYLVILILGHLLFLVFEYNFNDLFLGCLEWTNNGIFFMKKNSKHSQLLNVPYSGIMLLYLPSPCLQSHLVMGYMTNHFLLKLYTVDQQEAITTI